MVGPLNSTLVTITDDGMLPIHSVYTNIVHYNISDIVVISMENATSTVEGRPASIELTLNIADEGDLVCGLLKVYYSTQDSNSLCFNITKIISFSMLADPADYHLEYDGGVRFTAGTRLCATLMVPTVLDTVTETEEVFLLTVTDVITECQYQLENGISTVTIRDRESKSPQLFWA